ncbi:MAG: response regulator [Gemmatimonadetes bacterium]|nr:response regulator [Gemmatimonadota bacterium]
MGRPAHLMVKGDPPAPEASPEGRRGAGSRVHDELVLVVDDDAAVLRMAAKVLRRGGYEVLEAGGGREALKIAEEQGGRIKLLLTDVVMPEMGGREVSEELRRRYPHIRVLFMSAYTEDEVILRGVRVAEVNFVSKPFTVDGLRSKVRQVLDRPG